jgi:glycerophosphoryl diester phosphodiesterase
VLPSWLVEKPIAHRGLYDGQDRPENSLAAFQHAVEKGVPFEFDVQLSPEGELVVAHDRIGPGAPSLDDVLELVNGAVPVVVDVRRWGLQLDSRLERGVAGRIRLYRGEAAVQSFDPLAVFRLRRLLPDRPVGQISGALHSAGPIMRALGRTMATNAVTRPDFLVYELTELPSRFVSFWRSRGLPLLAFTVRSPEEERRARAVADNFFFSGYLA